MGWSVNQVNFVLANMIKDQEDIKAMEKADRDEDGNIIENKIFPLQKARETASRRKRLGIIFTP